VGRGRAAAKAHAPLSEANAYAGGDDELGEAGTHYERASAARAAAAVREPLAAPDAPGGSSPGGRVDPDVRAEALVEASFYDEVLHPRNRLGEWLHKEFGEVQASSKHTGKKRVTTEYRAARWTDRGQSHADMVGEAVRLLHPVPEEHTEIVKAVLADKPLPKGASKEAKAAASKLRKATYPDSRRGKWFVKLHRAAADAHAEQADKAGVPYIHHLEAVAETDRGRDRGRAEGGGEGILRHAMCATNGRTMTDWATQPRGECPNTPEDQVSDDAYEAWIAAMDKLIAEAPPAAQDSAPDVAQAQDDAQPSTQGRIQGRRRA
jgi:hypothetical protein